MRRLRGILFDKVFESHVAVLFISILAAKETKRGRMSDLRSSWELLFVDDYSSDDSWTLNLRIAASSSEERNI